LVDQFLASGVRVPAWHFGFLRQRLDLTRLDSPYPFLLAFPQNRTEAVLSERALALGARIVRGEAATGLAQTADGVEVRTENGAWQAGWVVGADGAGSTVRKAAGIDFRTCGRATSPWLWRPEQQGRTDRGAVARGADAFHRHRP
jgi:2-polyprenyl-6-methoxyphenol hydroxylase-like FAD-dependent oxidoreductase